MKNLCRRCGAELPENASFCPHCETPLGEKRPVRPAPSLAVEGRHLRRDAAGGAGDLSHLALGGFPTGDL